MTLAGAGSAAGLGGAARVNPVTRALAAAVPIYGGVAAFRKGRCGSGRYSYLMLTPASADGTRWVRWWIGTLLNPGGGVTGMIRATHVEYVDILANVKVTTHSETGTWIPYDGGAASAYIDGLRKTDGTESETATYTLTVEEGGSIAWEFASVSNAGIAWIVIRDSSDAEIAAGLYAIADVGGHREVDTYVAYPELPGLVCYSLAAGLPADDYTVEITASGTKNALSSAYRVYTRACYACGLTAGDPATAPMIDVPLVITGALGNIEYAAYVAPDGGAAEDRDYACGTHGYESDPSDIVLTVDGVDISAASIATTTPYGIGWAGASIVLTHTTTVSLRVGPEQYATLDHRAEFSRSGYRYSLVRTLLCAVDMQVEYLAMCMVPNATLDGFERSMLFPSGPRELWRLGFDTAPTEQSFIVAPNDGIIMYDENRAIGVATQRLERTYPPCAGEVSPPGPLVNRATDGYVKLYHGWSQTDAPDMRRIAIGDIQRYTCEWRAIYDAAGGVRASIEAPWAYAAPTALRAICLWLPSDATIVHGVEPKVESIEARVPSHELFRQTNTTYQPDLSALNGHPIPDFGGGGECLEANLMSKESLRYLHDGSGATVHIVCRPTALAALKPLLATTSTSTAHTGVILYASAAGALNWITTNGSGTGFAVSGTSASGVVANGVVAVVSVRTRAAGTEVRVNGTTRLSLGAMASPAAGDPTYTLMLGAYATGSANSWNGLLGELVAQYRYEDDTEFAAEHNRLRTKYGAA
jgi:hypothetical protein